MSLAEFDPGTQDPTPGVTGDESGNEQGNAAPQTAERTYTQADWTEYSRGLRRNLEAEFRRNSEREREAAIQAVRQEYEQRFAPKPERPQSPFAPEVESALSQWFQQQIGQHLAPLQETQTRSQIELGLTQFQSQHPEMSAEDVNNVLETALGFGEEVVNKAPIDWLLQQGYLAYKYRDFNEDELKQKAIDEYLSKKSRTNANTPRPQGPGAAVLPTQKRPKDFATADRMFEAMVQQANDE